jgi:uncharacterized coiled-coil protein SlyX
MLIGAPQGEVTAAERRVENRITLTAIVQILAIAACIYGAVDAFSRVTTQLKTLDDRLKGIDTQLTEQPKRIGALEIKVATNEQRINSIENGMLIDRQRLIRVEEKIDRLLERRE